MVGQGMAWGMSESCGLEALWEMLLCLQHGVLLSLVQWDHGRLGQGKKGEPQEHLAIRMLWLLPAG